MKEKIQKHIDALFTNAPKTRKAMELKEELTQNAFQNVIGSIGDVSELFEDLEEKNLLTLPEADRKKKATLTAVAVGLYIFAGVVFLFFSLIQNTCFEFGFDYFDYSLFGLVLGGLICIAPTCMLVYAAHMYPTFHKKEDSLVEDYKEAKYSANREKAIKSSVSALIWILTITLYFIVSFATWCWYATWIIFLIGACAQAIAVLALNLRRKE